MPKKTLQQKMRAQERRLAVLNQEIVSPTDQPEKEQAAFYSLPGALNARPMQPVPASAVIATNDISAIHQDIIRIAVVTLLALIMEGILFYVIAVKHIIL